MPACYVVSDEGKWRMKHGLAAFADEVTAITFAAGGGAAVVDGERLRVEPALAGHHR